MENFNNIYEEYTRKYNNELKKTGIFYAFSNEQFDENKTHKNAPDNQYLHIGGGAYIHKDNKEKLNIFFQETAKQLKKDFLSKININDLIEYELINHECYYTGNFWEIIPIIEEWLDTDISQRNDVAEQIEIIYRKTFAKNVEAFE